MALDYLPIQGSAVPSERVFSSSGLTGTDRRNRLARATFEALQILKAGYKGGMVKKYEEPEDLGGELNEEELDYLVGFVNAAE